MVPNATKKRACPRCHGTGTVEENATLAGIAPLLDRPSGVNDDDWFSLPEPEVALVIDDPTAVCQVPVFKVYPRRESSEPARSRLAAEPTPLPATAPKRAPRAIAPPPPREGRLRVVSVLVTAMTLGASFGAFAATHVDRWLPTLERAFAQVQVAHR